MRNIFIVSDTHFGHSNILKFTGSDGALIRPQFSNVEDMDEQMVDRWNSVVRDQDIIYHLGDVYFEHGHKVLKRLRGRKRLILGNHDNGKASYLQNSFEKILMWRVFKEFSCVLTHVPVHESALHKVQYNLHGHIHQNPSPDSQYINCCVEVQNYTPRSIEELIP